MNRKTFFASIFGAIGVARAQQWKQPTREEQYDSAGRKLTIGIQRDGKALNNQCPMPGCATIAAPYRNPPLCLGDGYSPMPCAPNERITRCRRCNAAFWQDAEA